MEKQEWLNGSFIKLNYVQIEKKIVGYIRNSVQIIKTFEQLDHKQALQISNEFKEDLENFKQRSWVIQFLTIEVMQKKSFYWKELFQKCEMHPIEPNDVMSMKVFTLKLDPGRRGHREPQAGHRGVLLQSGQAVLPRKKTQRNHRKSQTREDKDL